MQSFRQLPGVSTIGTIINVLRALAFKVNDHIARIYISYRYIASKECKKYNKASIGNHLLVLTDKGLSARGNNQYGQLGIGHERNSPFYNHISDKLLNSLISSTFNWSRLIDFSKFIKLKEYLSKRLNSTDTNSDKHQRALQILSEVKGIHKGISNKLLIQTLKDMIPLLEESIEPKRIEEYKLLAVQLSKHYPYSKTLTDIFILLSFHPFLLIGWLISIMPEQQLASDAIPTAQNENREAPFSYRLFKNNYTAKLEKAMEDFTLVCETETIAYLQNKLSLVNTHIQQNVLQIVTQVEALRGAVENKLLIQVLYDTTILLDNSFDAQFIEQYKNLITQLSIHYSYGKAIAGTLLVAYSPLFIAVLLSLATVGFPLLFSKEVRESIRPCFEYRFFKSNQTVKLEEAIHDMVIACEKENSEQLNTLS